MLLINNDVVLMVVIQSELERAPILCVVIGYVFRVRDRDEEIDVTTKWNP